MENAEPVMEILGESGAVESLSELIRAGQIVDSVKTVLGPVLNVLEGVPYVGAVARLASAILSGVAQAQEVKGACIEFQQLVSNIAPLLVQAREVFQSEDASKKSSAHGILKGLAEVLEEGNELIGIFKQRSWLGRFVRAARDQEDFEALSKRLLAMVQLLTASASVSNAQANKEVSSDLVQ